MADPLRILHNPRCSKSRACLAIIEASSSAVDLEVIRYLEAPLDRVTVLDLISRLDVPAAALVRTGDAAWRELMLAGDADEDLLRDSGAVASLLAVHPRLLQRPVVDDGTHALICRPPERVEALL